MSIQKSELEAVYASLVTGEKAYLTVYNNTENVIESTGTEHVLSKNAPDSSYSNIRVKRIPKDGTSSLNEIIDYMLTHSFASGNIVAMNKKWNVITYESTNLKIEFPDSYSINLWPDDPELPPEEDLQKAD